MYFALDPDKIIKLNAELLARIEKTFPSSGLKKVAVELFEIAGNSKETVKLITKPHLPLRITVGLIILIILCLSIWSWLIIHFDIKKITATEFVQTFEAFLNVVIFIGVALIFLFTAEIRIKRRRALKAIHELRAIAHVIDMHQLTKDPDVILIDPKIAQSVPTETMTTFELMRYLDFCRDMLSLIAKIAALYVQNFDDPIILSSVNDVESLTAALSTKIGQKIKSIHFYK